MAVADEGPSPAQLRAYALLDVVHERLMAEVRKRWDAGERDLMAIVGYRGDERVGFVVADREEARKTLAHFGFDAAQQARVGVPAGTHALWIAFVDKTTGLRVTSRLYAGELAVRETIGRVVH